MEGDDGTGRRGVGVGVEDHGRFVGFGVAAQDQARDQQVHVQVGLVQPVAGDLRHFHAGLGQGRLDHLGRHRAHFLEDLAALLAEQFVGLAHAGLVKTVEEAEIVADGVREARFEFRADDLELVLRHGRVFRLDDDGRAGVAENEMAVAVAPVQVAAGDFGIQDQHGARLAALHGGHGLLDAEGGRRTCHVHVKTITIDAERILHFHGHGRVGALHVAARHQYHVDIGRRAAGPRQRVFGGGHGHFRLQRQFVIAPLRDARDHARRVEDAFLFHHEARLDAGRLFDEGHARQFQRRHRARGDRVGVVGIELFRVSIEAGDQLFVGDRKWRRVQSGTADDDLFHG